MSPPALLPCRRGGISKKKGWLDSHRTVARLFCCRPPAVGLGVDGDDDDRDGNDDDDEGGGSARNPCTLVTNPAASKDTERNRPKRRAIVACIVQCALATIERLAGVPIRNQKEGMLQLFKCQYLCDPLSIIHRWTGKGKVANIVIIIIIIGDKVGIDGERPVEKPSSRHHLSTCTACCRQ